jgi:uridine nucleosidase
LSVLTAIGKDKEIPVYPGAHKPLVRLPVHAPTDIHGVSGLDGTQLLPSPLTSASTEVPAIDAIAAAVQRGDPGTAWLVATGPLTNVAGLFTKYPQLVGHIKGLSLMGGAIGGGFTDAVMGEVDGVPRIGNWTQYAEFNILADPEAAATIFENGALAKKTTLVPLDLTHSVLATDDVQQLLRWGQRGRELGIGGSSPLRVMVVELLMFFAKTYRLADRRLQFAVRPRLT